MPCVHFSACAVYTCMSSRIGHGTSDRTQRCAAPGDRGGQPSPHSKTSHVHAVRIGASQRTSRAERATVHARILQHQYRTYMLSMVEPARDLPLIPTARTSSKTPNAVLGNECQSASALRRRDVYPAEEQTLITSEIYILQQSPAFAEFLISNLKKMITAQVL